MFRVTQAFGPVDNPVIDAVVHDHVVVHGLPSRRLHEQRRRASHADLVRKIERLESIVQGLRRKLRNVMQKHRRDTFLLKRKHEKHLEKAKNGRRIQYKQGVGRFFSVHGGMTVALRRCSCSCALGVG